MMVTRDCLLAFDFILLKTVDRTIVLQTINITVTHVSSIPLLGFYYHHYLSYIFFFTTTTADTLILLFISITPVVEIAEATEGQDESGSLNKSYHSVLENVRNPCPTTLIDEQVTLWQLSRV